MQNMDKPQQLMRIAVEELFGFGRKSLCCGPWSA